MTELDAMLAPIRENPFDEQSRLIVADWFDERGDEKNAMYLRLGKVPCIGLDLYSAKNIDCCRFAPGTSDKRFAQDVAGAVRIAPCLTPRQFCWMWVLLHRYRASVKNREVRERAAELHDGYQELLLDNPAKITPRPKEPTWRQRAAPIIAEVLKRTSGASEKIIRRELTNAYPLAFRQGWAYQVWLSEVKRQRAKPPETFAAGSLFDGESHESFVS